MQFVKFKNFSSIPSSFFKDEIEEKLSAEKSRLREVAKSGYFHKISTRESYGAEHISTPYKNEDGLWEISYATQEIIGAYYDKRLDSNVSKWGTIKKVEVLDSDLQNEINMQINDPIWVNKKIDKHIELCFKYSREEFYDKLVDKNRKRVEAYNYIAKNNIITHPKIQESNMYKGLLRNLEKISDLLEWSEELDTDFLAKVGRKSVNMASNFAELHSNISRYETLLESSKNAPLTSTREEELIKLINSLRGNGISIPDWKQPKLSLKFDIEPIYIAYQDIDDILDRLEEKFIEMGNFRFKYTNTERTELFASNRNIDITLQLGEEYLTGIVTGDVQLGRFALGRLGLKKVF